MDCTEKQIVCCEPLQNNVSVIAVCSTCFNISHKLSNLGISFQTTEICDKSHKVSWQWQSIWLWRISNVPGGCAWCQVQGSSLSWGYWHRSRRWPPHWGEKSWWGRMPWGDLRGSPCPALASHGRHPLHMVCQLQHKPVSPAPCSITLHYRYTGHQIQLGVCCARSGLLWLVFGQWGSLLQTVYQWLWTLQKQWKSY